MSWLLEVYPGDAAVVAVAGVAAQAAAVVLLAWMISRLLARRNPAARYGVWFCALACVALGPLAGWCLRQADVSVVRLPLLAPRDAADDADGWATQGGDGFADRTAAEAALSRLNVEATLDANGREQADDIDVATAAAALKLGRPATSAAGLLRMAFAAAMLVWLGGLVWLIARLALGWRLLWVLRRELVPLAQKELGDVADRVCRTLGIKTLPQIAVCHRLGSPISLGLFRRVIVLPANLVDTLDAGQLHDVLVHETAHFLRRDHAVGILQRVVHAVFWPHPLIYLLSRELTRAREEVCDNYVIRDGSAPRYARTLLTLSQRPQPVRPALSAIGIMQPRGLLEQRVAGLLDSRRRRATRIGGPMLAVAALALVSVVVSIAGTRLVPADAPTPEEDAVDATAEVETDPTAVAQRPAVAEPNDSIDRPARLESDVSAGAEDGSIPFRATLLARAVDRARSELARGWQRLREARPLPDGPSMAGTPNAPAAAADPGEMVADAGGSGGIHGHRPPTTITDASAGVADPMTAGPTQTVQYRFTADDGQDALPYEPLTPAEPLTNTVPLSASQPVMVQSKPVRFGELELTTVAGAQWSFSAADGSNALFVGLCVTNVGSRAAEFHPADVCLMFRSGDGESVSVETDYAAGVPQTLTILPDQSQLLLIENVRIAWLGDPAYLALVGTTADGRPFEIEVSQEASYGVGFQYRHATPPWPVTPELQCQLVDTPADVLQPE